MIWRVGVWEMADGVWYMVYGGVWRMLLGACLCEASRSGRGRVQLLTTTRGAVQRCGGMDPSPCAAMHAACAAQ
jgi:hypothetical protein